MSAGSGNLLFQARLALELDLVLDSAIVCAPWFSVLKCLGLCFYRRLGEAERLEGERGDRGDGLDAGCCGYTGNRNPCSVVPPRVHGINSCQLALAIYPRRSSTAFVRIRERRDSLAVRIRSLIQPLLHATHLCQLCCDDVL